MSRTVILAHASADFDSFASAQAARRLYDDAEVVLARGLARGVREFVALHRDRFPSRAASEVDYREVTRAVLVDMRRAPRLADHDETLRARITRGDPSIEVDVWDHHPAAPDDVPARHAMIEPVGSTTTLLVEALRGRGLDVDAAEATLFALGIHADTVSLTGGNTSARDAHALAWLLSRGANISVIGRFVSPAFSRAQRDALSEALARCEEVSIAGLTALVSCVLLDDSLDGLADVTEELFRLESPHALVALWSYVRKPSVHVIGRARPGSIDLGAALAPFGGGGHPEAAAASVRGVSLDGLRAQVIESMRASATAPRRVRDLMSSPVRVARPDDALVTLRDSLEREGLRGAPVVRDGRLLGVITVGDIDRAMRDGRGHLTASSCMRQHARTTTEDTPIDEALTAMTAHDIGRLPVMRGEELVGIVTRADLLRVLYAAGG